MAVPTPNVKAVFDRALEIESPAERESYLANACAGDPASRRKVDGLLKAYADAGSFLETSDAVVGDVPEPTADYHDKDEHAGAVIAGKYTLVEPIGEGGMGSVWRAKQTEPVKRFVAVKLIKAGMDSKQVLARFDAERQALAVMDHPNIAKVLDGGLHERRPYFVMELVKGTPITQFCDASKLTPRERLELFVPVCQAIQHAHQKGIIHRDIKPSNVLVALYDDKPVPKVIDFGVAKATGGALTENTIDTGFGRVVGTPEYMSPEQATFNNLDIDTRSDVYALGALLYELLAGSPPFSRKGLAERGLLEILRVVREEEPPRPSTKLSTAEALPSLSANRGTEPKKLTGLLRNELDWIVMKALEKDRSRRYETANGFAADVNRYLSGEAVQAHPPSTAYRLKKFVRRNRGQVITASLVLFALIAGIAGTTLGLLEARRQTTLARTQEAEAKKQEGLAREEAAAKELARAEEAVQRKRAVEFRDKALDALRATTGTDVEKLIGGRKELGANEKAYLEAIANRWQAFAGQEGTDEQARAIRAEGHSNVASLWVKLGRQEEARPKWEQALLLWEKLAADYPAMPNYRRDLAGSHGNLGNLLAVFGKRAAAEEHYKKALLIQEKLAGDFPAVPNARRDLASGHSNLGVLLKDLGRATEAAAQHSRALVIRKKLAADFPDMPDYRSDLAVSHINLGILLAGLGKRADAEAHYMMAHVINEKLAADYPAVLEYRRELAGSHGSLGNLLGNLEHYKKALAIKEKVAADFPVVSSYRSDLAMSHNNLGLLLAGLKRGPEAEEQYRKALVINEKLAADSPDVPGHRRGLAGSHHNLGFLLPGLGKGREGEEHSKKALAIQEKLAADFPVPDSRSDLATGHNNLGLLLAGLGKRIEAEEHSTKAVEIQEKLAADFPAVPDYRSNLAAYHRNLGNVFGGREKWAGAEEHYKRAMVVYEKLAADFPAVPDYRYQLAVSHNLLGLMLAVVGKRTEAEEYYTKSLVIQEKLAAELPAMPNYRHELAVSHTTLASLLKDLGQGTGAEEHYKRAVVIQEKLAAEFPAVPDYRSELVGSHTNLGLLLRDLGKRADAEEQYKKALVVGEKLAANFPAVAEYRIELGGGYCNLGNLVGDNGRSNESVAWFDKAVATLGPVHRAQSGDGKAKQFLRNSHVGRALCHEHLQKSAEAAKDWDRAVELSAPAEQLTFRIRRAVTRMGAGQVAEAVAEVAELTRSSFWPAHVWFADKKAEYADRAMVFLEKAVMEGYKDISHMKKDTDLDGLRSRDDFKKLMADLDAKVK
jgi:serine/threonine protein kinase